MLIILLGALSLFGAISVEEMSGRETLVVSPTLQEEDPSSFLRWWAPLIGLALPCPSEGFAVSACSCNLVSSTLA